MKKITYFTLIALFVLSGIALAGTRLIKDSSKLQTPIQNLKGAAAGTAASRCDVVGSTSSVLKNYTAAGYIGIKANAYNKNTGAATVVKWSEDGKQVWTGSEYESVNAAGTAITTVTAAVFTGRSTAFCIRRQ